MGEAVLQKLVLTGDAAMVIMGEDNEAEWSVTLRMLRSSPFRPTGPISKGTGEGTDQHGWGGSSILENSH